MLIIRIKTIRLSNASSSARLRASSHPGEHTLNTNMLLKQHEFEVDRLRTQFANDRSVRPISGFDLFIRRTAHQVCRFSCQIVGVAIMSFVLTGAVGAAL